VATIVLTQIGRANSQGKVAMHIIWTIIIGFIAGFSNTAPSSRDGHTLAAVTTVQWN
jgi:hypothetical protein